MGIIKSSLLFSIAVFVALWSVSLSLFAQDLETDEPTIEDVLTAVSPISYVRSDATWQVITDTADTEQYFDSLIDDGALLDGATIEVAGSGGELATVQLTGSQFRTVNNYARIATPASDAERNAYGAAGFDVRAAQLDRMHFDRTITTHLASRGLEDMASAQVEMLEHRFADLDIDNDVSSGPSFGDEIQAMSALAASGTPNSFASAREIRDEVESELVDYYMEAYGLDESAAVAAARRELEASYLAPLVATSGVPESQQREIWDQLAWSDSFDQNVLNRSGGSDYNEDSPVNAVAFDLDRTELTALGISDEAVDAFLNNAGGETDLNAFRQAVGQMGVNFAANNQELVSNINYSEAAQALSEQMIAGAGNIEQAREQARAVAARAMDDGDAFAILGLESLSSYDLSPRDLWLNGLYRMIGDPFVAVVQSTDYADQLDYELNNYTGPIVFIFRVMLMIGMLLLGLIVFYIFFMGIIMTTLQGEPLGREWKTFHVPMRFATSMMLLAPLPQFGLLSVAQMFIILILLISTRLAGWVNVELFERTMYLPVVMPTPTEYEEFGGRVLNSLMCSYLLEKHDALLTPPDDRDDTRFYNEEAGFDRTLRNFGDVTRKNDGSFPHRIPLVTSFSSAELQRFTHSWERSRYRRYKAGLGYIDVLADQSEWPDAANEYVVDFYGDLNTRMNYDRFGFGQNGRCGTYAVPTGPRVVGLNAFRNDLLDLIQEEDVDIDRGGYQAGARDVYDRPGDARQYMIDTGFYDQVRSLAREHGVSMHAMVDDGADPNWQSGDQGSETWNQNRVLSELNVMSAEYAEANRWQTQAAAEAYAGLGDDFGVLVEQLRPVAEFFVYGPDNMTDGAGNALSSSGRVYYSEESAVAGARDAFRYFDSAYQARLIEFLNDNSNSIQGTLTDSIRELGFAGAGSFLWAIEHQQHELMNLFDYERPTYQSFPYSKYSSTGFRGAWNWLVGTVDDEQVQAEPFNDRDGSDFYDEWQALTARASDQTMATERRDFLDTLENLADSGDFGDGPGVVNRYISNTLSRSLQEWVFDADNPNASPLYTIRQTGLTIQNATSAIGATAFALNTIKSSAEAKQRGGSAAATSNAGAAMYGVMEAALPPLMAANRILFLVGFYMANIFPMIPWILWNMTVLGLWIYALEALLAVNIAAASIALPDGHDMMGGAKEAGTIVWTLVTRPIFAVFGLYIALSLHVVAGELINTMIQPATQLLSSDGRVDLYAFLRDLIILIIAHTAIAWKLYSLPHELPNAINRWTNMQDYGEIGEQEGRTQVGAIGGKFEGQAGQVTSAAGTGGGNPGSSNSGGGGAGSAAASSSRQGGK